MIETLRLASRVLSVMVLATLLCGCATRGLDPDANDPYEKTNRAIFKFNMGLDRYVMKPVATGYRRTFPIWTRSGIRSFLDNLQTPVYLVNNLLQGNFKGADATFARFAENTLFGPFGFRDVARTQGKIEAQPEDFGQTLAVWGVKNGGPYLVIPLLGPSNPRDLFGRVVDTAMDPQTYVNWGDHLFWIQPTEQTLDIVDSRSRNLDALDELQRSSVDFYASVRSLYSQARESAIRNGEFNVEQLPNF